MRKITWVTAVTRRHTPLLLSLVITGEQDSLLIKKQTGLSLTYSHIRRKGHDLQYDKAELDADRKLIHNEVEKRGIVFFDDYSRICIKTCEEFLQVAESINKLSVKQNNNRTYNKHLKLYFTAAISNAYHLIVLISVQFELEAFLKKFVDEQISSTQAAHIMHSLKITDEPTHEIANLEQLLEIGLLVQKTVPTFKKWIVIEPYILKARIVKEYPVIWKKIKRFQKKFGWMGRMYYAGNPITETDIIVRLQNCLRHNCRQRLSKIRSDRQKQLYEREKSITKLGADKDTRWLADIVSRYMYLRSYRLNVYFMAHEKIIPLMDNAAKRLKLDNGLNDIIFLDWREILAGLEGKINKKDLQNKIIQRHQGFEFLSIDGNLQWLTSEIKSSMVIKGIPASLGKYSGRVRIIQNDKAMTDMLPGEVLVTTMTTPSLMLAVEKAGAIITDEGGMLCHAAIVSRELNIPCVIATQKATIVLKDGDKVEVDAEKGLVKILK